MTLVKQSRLATAEVGEVEVKVEVESRLPKSRLSGLATRQAGRERRKVASEGGHQSHCTTWPVRAKIYCMTSASRMQRTSMIYARLIECN